MIKKLFSIALSGCVMGLATVVQAGDSCGGCPSNEKNDKKASEESSSGKE